MARLKVHSLALVLCAQLMLIWAASSSDRICLQLAMLVNAQRTLSSTLPILKSVKLDSAAGFHSKMMMLYQNLSHQVGDEPDFPVRARSSFFRAQNDTIYEKICQPAGNTQDACAALALATADATHMGCSVEGPDMNGAYWMTVIFAKSDGSEIGSEYIPSPSRGLAAGFSSSPDAALPSSVTCNNTQQLLQQQSKEKPREALVQSTGHQSSAMLPPDLPGTPPADQVAPMFPRDGPLMSASFGSPWIVSPAPVAFQPIAW